MNRLHTPRVNVTSEYFDSHGIHSVPTEQGDVHIFSFEHPKDLQAALENDLPSSGTILTPEMAAVDLSQGLGSLDEQQGAVRDIERTAQHMSMQTQAEIMLGTVQKNPHTHKWLNAVKTYRFGSKVDTQLKYRLSGLEIESDTIEPAPARERIVKMGRAVLICSELIFAGGEERDVRNATHTVYAPAAWGMQTPGFEEYNRPRIEAAGGIDAFNRATLDRAVTEATFADLPQLDTVIVADRGVNGNRPVNAVYRRTQ